MGSISVSPALGWLFIILAVLPNPIGNVLIKKSYEIESSTSRSWWFIVVGNILLLIVSPVTHVLAYFYGENAFIAPVIATGVLINIVLAWMFLKEGNVMNRFTLLGIVLFCIGLLSILWSYAALLDNRTNQNSQIDWGVFSLYLGIWIWMLTILTCVILFSRVRALLVWSTVSAVLAGLDVVGTYDKYIFDFESNSVAEIINGVLGSLVYIGACILAIYIHNQLLSDSANPVHIVATISTSLTLALDVYADMFIFQRYTNWAIQDWGLSIAGITLMLVGIWFMNIRYAPLQRMIDPIVTELDDNFSCYGDEFTGLLKSTSIHKTSTSILPDAKRSQLRRSV